MIFYNLYQGFKEKNFMEIVKRKLCIYYFRNKCCDIIDDGYKLIIFDIGYGWGKGGKEV